MTPEQIVRALAAADPVAYDGDRWDGDYACTLCDGRWSERGGDVAARASSHEPDCPWRLAREWVAAQDRRAAEYEPIIPSKALQAAMMEEAEAEDMGLAPGGIYRLAYVAVNLRP